MRQIAVDTETTGLKPEEGHRIIEIGLIEVVDRKITGKQLQYYLYPDREIDPGAQAVHGISLDFLKDKPRFYEIYPELLKFIDSAELIIHNAPFDLAFLNFELCLCRKNHPPLQERHRIVDTLLLARELHPAQKNNLDALCKRYSVDNSDRKLHGALLDADLLAKVYLAMTAGQIQLFEESIISDTKSTDIPSKEGVLASLLSDTCLSLEIQPASASELSAHQNYLHFLEKISENDVVSLWE